MRDADDRIQPLTDLLVLPLRTVATGAGRGRRVEARRGGRGDAHLRQRPRRPGGDGRGFGDGDDERGTAVQQVEDEHAAARAPRLRPHAAVGREAGEEDEHAVGADVVGGVGVAEGQGVGGFGKQFVREEVVSWFGS